MNTPELERIINKLIGIYLTKGVQPSELADAIFEESYLYMTSIKNENFIEFIISYTEKCDVTNKDHIRNIKYIYNHDQFVMKIEEAVDSKKFRTIWDRSKVIHSLVEEIKNCLELNGYCKHQISKILNTIPQNLRDEISLKLKLVA